MPVLQGELQVPAFADLTKRGNCQSVRRSVQQPIKGPDTRLELTVPSSCAGLAF